ncbi:MAG: SMI1/KNR4 family protein [Polyangiaceae bacterium]|nr:SMI1/KNR4 family protein [Polyangiaceae bacterium]
MSDLTLAQRLLVRIGQISERSDVIVQQQSVSRGNVLSRIGKWQPKLPADMYAFYRAINGLKFNYSFADSPDDWHGLEFVALDEEGRKTIDTFRNIYRIPHQVAKRYPNYFFQDGAVDPETPVLFFFGDDGAWGIIMIGEGDKATFHHWDNDGFVRYLTSSFTELIEKLIARGFAHTWAYSDDHPDTDAVLARLAKPSPPRTTFGIDGGSFGVSIGDGYAYDDDFFVAGGSTRQSASGAWHDEASQGAFVGGEDRAHREVVFVDRRHHGKGCDVGHERAGYRKRNRDDFGEHFRCGAGPIAMAKLRIEYLAGPIPLQPYETTLLRVLHRIEGLHVTDGLPWPSEVLSYTHWPRHNLGWTPFISCTWDYEFKGDKNKVATFDVVLDGARAEGMEVGKTYASTALPSVEGRIG